MSKGRRDDSVESNSSLSLDRNEEDGYEEVFRRSREDPAVRPVAVEEFNILSRSLERGLSFHGDDEPLAQSTLSPWNMVGDSSSTSSSSKTIGNSEDEWPCGGGGSGPGTGPGKHLGSSDDDHTEKQTGQEYSEAVSTTAERAQPSSSSSPRMAMAAAHTAAASSPPRRARRLLHSFSRPASRVSDPTTPPAASSAPKSSPRSSPLSSSSHRSSLLPPSRQPTCLPPAAAATTTSTASNTTTASHCLLPTASLRVPRGLHIAILVCGTQGDVQPFVLIGQALRRDGHRVRLATHELYRDYVLKAGLEFAPLAGDPKKLSATMVETGGRIIPLSATEVAALPEKTKMVCDIMKSCLPACCDDDDDDEKVAFALALGVTAGGGDGEEVKGGGEVACGDKDESGTEKEHGSGGSAACENTETTEAGVVVSRSSRSHPIAVAEATTTAAADAAAAATEIGALKLMKKKVEATTESADNVNGSPSSLSPSKLTTEPKQQQQQQQQHATTPATQEEEQAVKKRTRKRVPFRAQAIISNPVTYGHLHVAEYLDVPLHLMFPQPWCPTSAFPHPLSSIHDRRYFVFGETATNHHHLNLGSESEGGKQDSALFPSLSGGGGGGCVGESSTASMASPAASVLVVGEEGAVIDIRGCRDDDVDADAATTSSSSTSCRSHAVATTRSPTHSSSSSGGNPATATNLVPSLSSSSSSSSSKTHPRNHHPPLEATPRMATTPSQGEGKGARATVGTRAGAVVGPGSYSWFEGHRRYTNRVSYALVDQFMWLAFRDMFNAFRMHMQGLLRQELRSRSSDLRSRATLDTTTATAKRTNLLLAAASKEEEEEDARASADKTTAGGHGDDVDKTTSAAEAVTNDAAAAHAHHHRHNHHHRRRRHRRHHGSPHHRSRHSRSSRPSFDEMISSSSSSSSEGGGGNSGGEESGKYKKEEGAMSGCGGGALEAAVEEEVGSFRVGSPDAAWAVAPFNRSDSHVSSVNSSGSVSSFNSSSSEDEDEDWEGVGWVRAGGCADEEDVEAGTDEDAGLDEVDGCCYPATTATSASARTQHPSKHDSLGSYSLSATFQATSRCARENEPSRSLPKKRRSGGRSVENEDEDGGGSGGWNKVDDAGEGPSRGKHKTSDGDKDEDGDNAEDGDGDLAEEVEGVWVGLEKIRAGESGSNLVNDLKIPFAKMWSPSLVPPPADYEEHIDIIGNVFPPLPPTREHEKEKGDDDEGGGKSKGGGTSAGNDYKPSPEFTQWLAAAHYKNHDNHDSSGASSTPEKAGRSLFAAATTGGAGYPMLAVEAVPLTELSPGRISSSSSRGGGGDGVGSSVNNKAKEEEKPVFVGFGSMMIQDPARLVKIIEEAAAMTRTRVILQSSWTDLKSKGDNTCRSDSVDGNYDISDSSGASSTPEKAGRSLFAAATTGGAGYPMLAVAAVPVLVPAPQPAPALVAVAGEPSPVSAAVTAASAKPSTMTNRMGAGTELPPKSAAAAAAAAATSAEKSAVAAAAAAAALPSRTPAPSSHGKSLPSAFSTTVLSSKEEEQANTERKKITAATTTREARIRGTHKQPKSKQVLLRDATVGRSWLAALTTGGSGYPKDDESSRSSRAAAGSHDGRHILLNKAAAAAAAAGSGSGGGGGGGDLKAQENSHGVDNIGCNNNGSSSFDNAANENEDEDEEEDGGKGEEQYYDDFDASNDDDYAEVANCNNVDDDKEEWVFHIGPCPHEWLFSRVSAVVHHGGAGTVAAGLRAGKPTLVCPFFGDQYFWARAVEEAGVGLDLGPVTCLTTEKLAAAFRKLRNPPSYTSYTSSFPSSLPQQQQSRPSTPSPQRRRASAPTTSAEMTAAAAVVSATATTPSEWTEEASSSLLFRDRHKAIVVQEEEHRRVKAEDGARVITADTDTAVRSVTTANGRSATKNYVRKPQRREGRRAGPELDRDDKVEESITNTPLEMPLAPPTTPLSPATTSHTATTVASTTAASTTAGANANTASATTSTGTDMAVKAQRLAAAFELEDGCGSAVACFYKHLPLDALVCDVSLWTNCCARKLLRSRRSSSTEQRQRRRQTRQSQPRQPRPLTEFQERERPELASVLVDLGTTRSQQQQQQQQHHCDLERGHYYDDERSRRHQSSRRRGSGGSGGGGSRSMGSEDGRMDGTGVCVDENAGQHQSCHCCWDLEVEDELENLRAKLASDEANDCGDQINVSGGGEEGQEVEKKKRQESHEKKEVKGGEVAGGNGKRRQQQGGGKGAAADLGNDPKSTKGSEKETEESGDGIKGSEGGDEGERREIAAASLTCLPPPSPPTPPPLTSSSSSSTSSPSQSPPSSSPPSSSPHHAPHPLQPPPRLKVCDRVFTSLCLRRQRLFRHCLLRPHSDTTRKACAGTGTVTGTVAGTTSDHRLATPSLNETPSAPRWFAMASKHGRSMDGCLYDPRDDFACFSSSSTVSKNKKKIASLPNKGKAASLSLSSSKVKIAAAAAAAAARKVHHVGVSGGSGSADSGGVCSFRPYRGACGWGLPPPKDLGSGIYQGTVGFVVKSKQALGEAFVRPFTEAVRAGHYSTEAGVGGRVMDGIHGFFNGAAHGLPASRKKFRRAFGDLAGKPYQGALNAKSVGHGIVIHHPRGRKIADDDGDDDAFGDNYDYKYDDNGNEHTGNEGNRNGGAGGNRSDCDDRAPVEKDGDSGGGVFAGKRSDGDRVLQDEVNDNSLATEGVGSDHVTHCGDDGGKQLFEDLAPDVKAGMPTHRRSSHQNQREVNKQAEEESVEEKQELYDLIAGKEKGTSTNRDGLEEDSNSNKEHAAVCGDNTATISDGDGDHVDCNDCEEDDDDDSNDDEEDDEKEFAKWWAFDCAAALAIAWQHHLGEAVEALPSQRDIVLALLTTGSDLDNNNEEPSFLAPPSSSPPASSSFLSTDEVEEEEVRPTSSTSVPLSNPSFTAASGSSRSSSDSCGRGIWGLGYRLELAKVVINQGTLREQWDYGLGVTRQELSARLAARAPLASRAAAPVTHHHGEVKEVGGSTTEMGPPPNASAVCRSFYTLSGRQR